MRETWSLEARYIYFPCMSGPGLQTTRCLPQSQLLSLSHFFPVLPRSLTFFLQVSLKQALSVIMRTQFTRGL